MLSTMRFIFERTKTPLEVMRENRRLMERGMREIEREKQSLHTIELKLIQEIKKAAKLNQWVTFNLNQQFACKSLQGSRSNATADAVRIMTVDIIRTRHRIVQCYELYQQLKSISFHTQTLKSTEAMADALQGFTKVARQLNLQGSQTALQKILQEFDVHHMRMDVMLSEVEDDEYYEEEEEEYEMRENEDVIFQVLEEIGVDFDTSELMNAPQVPQPAPVQKAVCEAPRIGIGLRDRMNRLRMA